MSSTTLLFIIIILLLLLLINHSSSQYNLSTVCDPGSLPDPLSLRSDKLTVLISGYSPSRVLLLRSLALSYSSHPAVLAVLILWFNPNFHPASLGLGDLPPTISLHLHHNSSSLSLSLSARFLPRGAHIRTRSGGVGDDDVEISARALSFAFRVHQQRRRRQLVGLFARSHDFDLDAKSWIYTVHPDRYSIVLTKLMVVSTEYLYRYTCDGRLREAREYVERERNCEDILMNFVAAMEEGGEGPPVAAVVEAKGGVRDWGDPRNDDGDGSGGGGGGGALSARGDHRKKRGECIREFHRLIGEMPLRYSYGKVVEGVGEQGLCIKSGKLVPCDSQE